MTISETEALIPSLPDEISEYCLLHLPFPYQHLARPVSNSWNKAISNPNFLSVKKSLSLSLPYIFVFAFHKSTGKLQWQVMDPRSNRWFVLPPMPCPNSVSPSGFACSSLPRQGELLVMGGWRYDTQSHLQTLISYKVSTNSWSLNSPMPTPRSHFTAGTIGGKIFAAGGFGVDLGDDSITTVECYDPAKDGWAPVANMRTGLSRYDSTVIGSKMFVTEGWSWVTWPSGSSRGAVYDAERDVWEEMKRGLREGWTGVSVVLDDRLFVIPEHGGCKVKMYVPESDTWEYLNGGSLPLELQKPFVVSGVEGKIYVISRGLDVGIGRVCEMKRGEWWVEWEVLVGPKSFEGFFPSCSQVLYA
ncbi:galactose oxidase/kelch repeat superfamily protein [Tasmannia lanceolata]|uniref:galactose oxidase/kelch repeat superfamily protein n=1 Tax=Tasmannia lanceolata TaxID=3420 RepID=UPI004064A3CE